MFMSQVIIVTKLLLVASAADTVSKRSSSALRRTKTWLRATMTQKRLNNCMLLHVHKEKVDNFNIIAIAHEFGCANESRLSTFDKFSEHDFQTRLDNATNFVYALKQVCFVYGVGLYRRAKPGPGQQFFLTMLFTYDMPRKNNI